MSEVSKLLEEIKLKAQLEARYYQGAIDALTLILSQSKENKEETDGQQQ